MEGCEFYPTILSPRRHYVTGRGIEFGTGMVGMNAMPCNPRQVH